MHQPPSQLPDITLLNQEAKPVHLAETLGKFVVIYFYPKAMTPGCTQQACSIRDNHDTLAKLHVTTYGVSPDNPSTLAKFKEKEQLNFDLLSDDQQTLATQFHSWVSKSMYGRNYMGLSRDVFLYSPEGQLLTFKRKISPKEHVSFITDFLSNCKN